MDVVNDKKSYNITRNLQVKHFYILSIFFGKDVY